MISVTFGQLANTPEAKLLVSASNVTAPEYFAGINSIFVVVFPLVVVFEYNTPSLTRYFVEPSSTVIVSRLTKFANAFT